MPDPTTKKPCPACGRSVDTNDLGQTYSHGGCPYNGNGVLTAYDVYPLTFASGPAMKVAIASERGLQAATIRHPVEDEVGATFGDWFSIQPTGTKRALGIAKVVGLHRGSLREVHNYALDSSALYPTESRTELLDNLNTYYTSTITETTEMVGYVFDPTVTVVRSAAGTGGGDGA